MAVSSALEYNSALSAELLQPSEFTDDINNISSYLIEVRETHQSHRWTVDCGKEQFKLMRDPAWTCSAIQDNLDMAMYQYSLHCSKVPLNILLLLLMRLGLLLGSEFY